MRDIRRTWPGYSARIIAVTADAFEASAAAVGSGLLQLLRAWRACAVHIAVTGGA